MFRCQAAAPRPDRATHGRDAYAHRRDGAVHRSSSPARTMAAMVPAFPAFAPGASPFHAKGLVFTGARDFYDATVPGGMAALLKGIESTGDTPLAEFLRKPFLASGWYDILPILAMSATAARLRQMQHAQLVRENAAWLAERDLRGVYRMVLAILSIEAVATRLGKLSMQYFDFGSAETRKIGDRTVESVRSGIPAQLASWFIFAADGFVPVALRMAGAKTVSIRHGHPRPDAAVQGCPAVQIRFELEWT
jgi:hypothetical protein